MDAIITTTRICVSEDFGSAEVTCSVHTGPPAVNNVLLAINNMSVLDPLVCGRLMCTLIANLKKKKNQIKQITNIVTVRVGGSLFVLW